MENKRLIRDLISVDLKKRGNLHTSMVRSRITSETGEVIDKVEVISIDHSKPFTPQSGIDTKIGDIGYYIKHNMKYDTETVYLSKVRTGNPFDLQTIGDIVCESTKDVQFENEN